MSTLGAESSSEIDRGELIGQLRKVIEQKWGGKKLRVNQLVVRAIFEESQDAEGVSIHEDWIRTPDSEGDKLAKPIHDLVNEACDVMETIARKAGGHTRFLIQVFLPGSDKAVKTLMEGLYCDRTHIIDMDSGGAPGGKFGGTERGERAAELAHREKTLRLGLNFVSDQMRESRQYQSLLHDNLMKMTAAVVRMADTVEKATTQALQRELAVKSQAKKDAMVADFMSTFMSHLPLIFQYLAGGSGAMINLGESPNVQSLKKLYETLDPNAKEELETFISKFAFQLEPAKQAVVLQVFQDLQKSEIRSSLKKIDQHGTSMPSLKMINE